MNILIQSSLRIRIMAPVISTGSDDFPFDASPRE